MPDGPGRGWEERNSRGAVPVASVRDSLRTASWEACGHCPLTLGWPGSGGTSFLPPSSLRLHRLPASGPSSPDLCGGRGSSGDPRGHGGVRRAGTCSSGSRGRPHPAGSACAPCAAESRAPACRRRPPRPGDEGLLSTGLRGQRTPATAPAHPAPPRPHPGPPQTPVPQQLA